MTPKRLYCTLMTIAGLAWSSQAYAHAFTSGSDLYENFVEGMFVVLLWPPTIGAMIGLGLLAGLWKKDGMVEIWPAMLGGQILGLLLSFVQPPFAAIAPYALGIITATLAAILMRQVRHLPQILAFATGTVVLLNALDGHQLGSLPVMIYIGILFGANLGVLLPAALVSSSLENWTVNWLGIGWRVVAAWTAAISIMLLAFELRPGL